MSAGAVRRRPHRHRAVSSPLPGMRTFITSLFFFMQESRPQESDSSSFTWCERLASESMNGHVLECCGTAQTDVIEELRVACSDEGERTGEGRLRTAAIGHSRRDVWLPGGSRL